MSDIAIRVDNLSKLYRIGRVQQRHDTLRDQLTDMFLASLRRFISGRQRSPLDGSEDTIWALKDVSFEVKRGEVMGIIGRNGAGKSTLLKILSRVTEPTEGRAVIKGRVGSLLEVGTGFHPELTGRENIYLNGAVLGMKRAEIDRKFDEIVDFAEIERFIDTPVKRYSSGMYVRLAFAVAAHLEPEVLLVDEVLAVGDAAFQRKCLGKMGDVAKKGRTVLFVSHNMAAVQALCDRSILLDAGRLADDGTSDEVIQKYLQIGAQRGVAHFGPQIVREGNGRARYTSARLLDQCRQVVSSVPMGGSVIIELEFKCCQKINYPTFGVRLHTALNQDIVAWRTQQSYGQMPPTSDGGLVRLYIEDLNLVPGSYYVALGFSDGYQTLDLIENALVLEVVPQAIYRTGTFTSLRRGEVMFTPCSWDYEYQ